MPAWSEVEVVGRLAPPDIDDVADRLREHLVAVDTANAQRLGVRFERAGAHPEQEPPLQQVVQHRGLRGDQDRVRVRQIGRAGAELDLPRVGDQARLEQHGVRDALGRVGDVLADVGLGVPQPVGKNDGLAVLLQDFRVVPVQAVDRHGEESELHGPPPARRVDTRLMPRDGIAHSA